MYEASCGGLFQNSPEFPKISNDMFARKTVKIIFQGFFKFFPAACLVSKKNLWKFSGRTKCQIMEKDGAATIVFSMTMYQLRGEELKILKTG